jgi:hypothetical protein
MENYQMFDWSRRPKRLNQITAGPYATLPVYGVATAPALAAVSPSVALPQPIVQMEWIVNETYAPKETAGEGGCWFRIGYLEAVFNFNSGTSTSALYFPVPLPKRSRVKIAQIINDNALVYGGAAVNLGIGVSGHPVDIIQGGTGTTLGTLSTNWPSAGGTNTDNSTGTTPLNLLVSACNGTSASGTVTGVVRCALWVEWFGALNSAPPGLTTFLP